MKDERERNLAKNVSSDLNAFGFNDKSFCEQMSQEHRTLQQSFTRLCVSWIRHCATLEHWQIDGRNEMSVKACKIMADALDDNDIQGLPMI